MLAATAYFLLRIVHDAAPAAIPEMPRNTSNPGMLRRPPDFLGFADGVPFAEVLLLPFNEVRLSLLLIPENTVSETLVIIIELPLMTNGVENFSL